MLRILNLRDVTKEVRAQAELSESQQLMEDRARRDEAAQRLGHFGYWDRSLDTDALHWTDEVYRIFGVTQGEFEPTGTAFDEFVHPEDRNTIREMRRRTLDEGTRYAVRHRIVRPDGVVRTVDETGDLVRDELDKRSMLVGTIRDVTELVAVEDELRDSDAHLRSILDSSQHAVLVMGSGDTVDYRNRAFSEMLGYAVDEFRDRNLAQFAAPESADQAAAAVYAVTSGAQQSADVRLQLVRKDGELVDVDAQIVAVQSAGRAASCLIDLQDVTRRVAAERQIAEGETRFREIFDTASSGLLIIGADGTPETANDAFLDIFGLETTEIGEHTPSELVVDERERAEIELCLDQHLKGEEGSCQHVLEIHRYSDGQTRHVSVTCQTLFHNGGVRGVLTEFTDRTEQIESERALTESRERLQQAQQIAHVGHWDWDIVTDELSWSDEVFRIFGLARPQFGATYPAFLDAVHQDDRDAVTAAVEDAVERGARYRVQYRAIRPDGEIRNVEESGEVSRLEDGTAARMLGIVQDVTERVASEQALAESESRLRAIFDASHNGISFFSDRRTPPFRNRAFAEMLGYTPEETRDLALGALLPLDEDHAWIDDLWERVGRGEPATDLGLKHFVHKDGHIVDVDIKLSDVALDGGVIGHVADLRDVTTELIQRRALEASETRARLIFESTSSGLLLMRLNGEIEIANQAFCDILGIATGEVRTLEVHRIIDRQDVKPVFELFRARLRGDLTTPAEVIVRFNRLDDGRTRGLRVDARPLIEDGEVAGMLAEVRDITERVETRGALEESQARLARAQANARIGGWELDVASNELTWSDELYGLFGQDPETDRTSIGGLLHGIHKDDRARFSETFEQAQAAGTALDVRVRFTGADGRPRIVWSRGELVVDEHGEPLRWEGTTQDITELAEAQQALAASEARLNLAQSIAHVGSWGRHLVRNESYWSDEFFRLMGLEPGVGEPSLGRLLEYMHPDDRARFQETTRDAVDRYDVRVRCIGEDGVERLLWMHGELTRDGHGKPLRWDGTSQDITELAQAQEALAEAAARLELAQSQAHVGSFSRNLATGAAYWSDEFYRLIGHEPGAIEPSSEHLYSMMQANDRDQFLEAIRDATDSRVDGYDIRSRFVRTDGQERVLWQYGELTRDPEGVPLRWDGTMQDVTELVTAQNALAEREEFLRTTLDAVRSGVMVVNAARQIISANGNASEIMGYAPDEFLSVQLENVVHGEDLALMLTRFAARVRGEEGPERTLVRAWKQDGTEIDLDVRGAPLMQSGELRGVVVDFRDVTEELAVQRRLEDTANHLRTLFETVRSGLLVVGPDMVPITCNDALATMLGSSTDDVLSQSVDAFLLPEERQIVGEAMEARMRGEVVLGRIPSTIIRADGVQRAVDIRSTPFIVDGQTIGLLCEVNDITEDLALQQEVQETAERLNTVVETVSTGLIVVGLDQRPMTVNQALCDILGYTREALMEKTFAEISHPDDAAFLLERFAQLLSGSSSPNRHQSRALRADGSVIHVDISAEPFRIGGELVGVLGEVRDITEALALQQEVENTAERLNTVFESVSTGLAIIGPDRYPITVNPALCEITGYSREELLARSFEEGLYPEDVEGLLQRFRDRISGEIDRQTEYSTRIIRKDGSTAQIAISSEPFHIGGQFIGILAEIRDVTEELSLQRQIQETADRLNNVFESVSTGLLVIGPNRIPLTVNQALCQITGYPREMLLSTRFDDLIHQDDLAPVTGRFASRMAGGEGPHHLQARTIRRDGTTITVDLSAEPFRVGGEIVGVLAEVRDITDDLELQHRVQETADRLSNVFESVSTGLAVIGPDRRPHTMNQAFAEILGRSQEELSAETFDRHLHPDDLELILQRFARRLAGEEVVPHHINVRVIRGDGELIDIDLSARPFVIGGAITGVLAEIRDITEELSLQALVTESAEQINTILEATPDAIIVADDHDVILRVNAATETIFGGGPDELIGQSVKMLVGGLDGEVDPTDAEHRQRAGSTSAIQELVASNFREATGQRLDGSEFPAELAVAETELNDGRKLFVAAIRDITERKHAEEQLQLLNTELETRSRERQALVQQLLSAQEEERRTVAYEIHDGPAQQLAAAQMFLEAFAFEQNIDIEDQSADHLQRAKAYLDTGLTETRRIMSGLRPALLDDLGLADALHQLLTELANRAGIQLELDSSKLVDDLSPAIEITLYRIAQEAAGNALKHSGSEELSVHLESDGSMARLRVTDHGRGFNPNTIQGPRDGRRFGLVGMRERVALLEGQFEVDSAPGRGTTITATIPLREDIDK